MLHLHLMFRADCDDAEYISSSFYAGMALPADCPKQVQFSRAATIVHFQSNRQIGLFLDIRKQCPPFVNGSVF